MNLLNGASIMLNNVFKLDLDLKIHFTWPLRKQADCIKS